MPTQEQREKFMEIRDAVNGADVLSVGNYVVAGMLCMK